MKKYFEENELAELPMVELGDELADAAQVLYGNMIFYDSKGYFKEDAIALLERLDLNTATSALYMVGVCEAILSKLNPDAVEEAFGHAALLVNEPQGENHAD